MGGYDCTTFADNALLMKLLEEYHIVRQQERKQRIN
jgi:hypothetical protein